MKAEKPLPQWVHVSEVLWSSIAACLAAGANLPVGTDAESRSARDAHASLCGALARAINLPVAARQQVAELGPMKVARSGVSAELGPVRIRLEGAGNVELRKALMRHIVTSFGGQS